MSRKTLTTAFGALAAAGAVAVAGAAADGGPSPGVETGWDGVRTPGGALRYVAIDTGRNTVLSVIRTSDGRVLRYGVVAGSFGIPLVASDGSTGGLAHNGKKVVLASVTGPKPAASSFAVVSTKALRLQQLVRLRGAWSFDALSPDGTTMYLIQYNAASGYARYRVRAYDLAARRLVPGAIVDKTEPGPMVGSPVTRTTSADGAWAYTLYARPAGKPFVHALDTVHGTARCLDVDGWRGSGNAIWRTRLALSPDGKNILLRRAGRTEAAVASPGP
jgi:hypothetical protein